MADDTSSKTDDSEPLEKWQGHIKSVLPSATFESEIKKEELPARQQAERAAQIARENKALVHEPIEDKPVQPAMPLKSANSVYPDSSHGIDSSQSVTPRFNFDTTDSTKNPEKLNRGGFIAFFKKLFGR